MIRDAFVPGIGIEDATPAYFQMPLQCSRAGRI